MNDGWMASGQETVFCWVPLPTLITVVTSIASFATYLLATEHKASGLLVSRS
jgi:hypothetical protein